MFAAGVKSIRCGSFVSASHMGRIVCPTLDVWREEGNRKKAEEKCIDDFELTLHFHV